MIPRKSPAVGYTVYGQGRSALHKWDEGIVIAVLKDKFFDAVSYLEFESLLK